MLEHYTEAFVLGNKTDKEIDAQIVLYTRDFGKVTAKAKSARKLTSKLNGHLQPLNFINARLVEKNGFQIVDALAVGDKEIFDKNSEVLSKFLNIAEFINEMTFELHQDTRLWQEIKKIFSANSANLEEKIIYRGLLRILGFNPEGVSCAFCGDSRANYFLKPESVFLCAKCAGKVDKNQLLFINSNATGRQ
jgi:DNA repair protein RecO